MPGLAVDEVENLRHIQSDNPVVVVYDLTVNDCVPDVGSDARPDKLFDDVPSPLIDDRPSVGSV